MKSIVVVLTTVCLVFGGGFAFADPAPGTHHDSAASAESTHEDVKTHQDCAHCGMDREAFSHSRMLITYTDGTSVGTCSIHCLVTELKANKVKTVASVKVADYDTKKLIKAEKAFWVIGGDKRGVMTQNPKWAFSKKAAAEAFIMGYGGKLATYKEALDEAEKN